MMKDIAKLIAEEKRKVGRPKGSGAGYVNKTVTLTPGQVAWLESEADRESADGERESSLSAVVRTAVDYYKARIGKRRSRDDAA